MKLVLVAAAALIRDGRVLLARRPEGKPLAGFWEFPGGKLEPNEIPEACLVRELEEELSIRVDQVALEPLTFASHALSEDKHLMMPLWAITEWDGEPVGAEGQQLEWVAPDEIGNYKLPPADIPLIPVVQSAIADRS